MTLRTNALHILSILFILIIFSPFVRATDIVRMNTGGLTNDVRVNYRLTLLREVLDITEVDYGPYEIKIIDIPTTAARALLEVNSGESINLFTGVTTKGWETENLAIKIPIRRGILNYRLLAVNKNDVDKFKAVNSLNDLKRLGAGLRLGWQTTKNFKQEKIKYFELESLDGLYNMLNNNAIDYIPRGIHEIYSEIEIRKPNDIIVEPTLMLIMPAPTYFIVSPSEVRLAARIEAGLEMMISNGRLKSMFYEFFGKYIKKANLQNRKKIIIPNSELPLTIPFERHELWFNRDQ